MFAAYKGINLDPVAAVAARHGKTPLQVLKELRLALIEDHPDVIRRNPVMMDRLNELIKERG
jgi:hypothetical protein